MLKQEESEDGENNKDRNDLQDPFDSLFKSR